MINSDTELKFEGECGCKVFIKEIEDVPSFPWEIGKTILVKNGISYLYVGYNRDSNCAVFAYAPCGGKRNEIPTSNVDGGFM